MNTTPPPLFVVAGFGRCGLTATMQILWVGGAPMIGRAPAFEDIPGTARLPLGDDPATINAQRGRVLKLLDPSVAALPPIPARTVWLERDHTQQARSALKFMRQTGTLPGKANRAMIGRFRKSYRADTPKAIARLHRHGPVIRVRFEDLLADPVNTAQRLADHFGRDVFPEPETGAAIILPRGPECQPDLAIEERAIRAAQTISQEVTP